MKAVHIVVGASGELKAFRERMETHESVFWPLPKPAQIGDDVLFLIPAFVGDIVASGTVAGTPVLSENWTPSRYQAEIGEIRFRTYPVPIAVLQDRLPDWKYLGYARSYTTVPVQFLESIEELLRVNRRFDIETGVSPDEVEPLGTYREGSVHQVTVNAYERDTKARRRCIDHYGTSCSVCGLNFAEVYGPIAEGFIHVHHLRPLAEIGEDYQVNPIADLRPVCPNCHAILHRRIPPYSLEELKDLLEERRASNR